MSYIITFLGVIIGYIIAVLLKPKKNKNIKLLLSFSGSFLLSITVLHLLPDLYSNTEINHKLPIGVFIMLGILLQIILEFFSKGAEHGHVHIEKTERIPWLLFISLCFHAFLEGFPLIKNDNLALGIAIHHLPIAIILTTFFYKSKLTKFQVFILIFTFALMTPMGAFFSNEIIAIQEYSKQITAIVVGILFHIASTIIFESNEGHKFNLAKVTVIVLGIVFAILLEQNHSHYH